MVQSQRLVGKTALVTGSTSGIGRAIAIAFAAEGATVAVTGRDAGRGDAAVAAIRAAGGDAVFVPGDLGAAPAAVRELAAAATDALGGRVDVLVNNAGVYPAPSTLELDEATYDAVMGTNVRSVVFLTQALLPGMLERGAGVVVNVGSWISAVGVPAGGLYAASKAAVEQLTRGWAAELGPRGIRFVAVAPGITATEGTAGGGQAILDAAAAMPAGRIGTPEDVAAATVFLASDDASFVHGSTLVADGGALSTRPV